MRKLFIQKGQPKVGFAYINTLDLMEEPNIPLVSDDADQIFKEGRQAYKDADILEDNPYNNADVTTKWSDAEIWIMGWNYEKELHEQQRTGPK